LTGIWQRSTFEIQNPIIMKRTEPQNVTLMSSVVKAISAAIASLFFTDNNREFQRLKNFITS